MTAPQMIARILAASGLLACAGLATPAQAATCPRTAPIAFAAGTSGGTVEGSVIRGERDCWTLRVAEGQTMTVSVAAPEKNAAFAAYLPGWKVAKDADDIVEVTGDALDRAAETDEATAWTGRLPRSGNYLIVVGGTRGNAGYRLKVTVK